MKNVKPKSTEIEPIPEKLVNRSLLKSKIAMVIFLNPPVMYVLQESGKDGLANSQLNSLKIKETKKQQHRQMIHQLNNRCVYK